MNGYERIKMVLDGKKPDRVPIMLHNFMSAAEGLGVTMAEFRSSPEKFAKAFVNAAEKYGLDGILTDVDTALLADACGAKVEFPDDEPALVSGPVGASVDEILEKMNPDTFYKHERLQIYLEGLKLIKKQVGNEIFIRGNADQGPFSLASLLYGMENFLMDLLDESKAQQLKMLLDRCYDIHLAWHKKIFETGVHCTSFGDSCCGPNLISPKMYVEFSKPWHKRLVKDLKSSGITTVCHICGNLDAIVEDVVDAGFEAIEIDYKTDIVRAQKVLKSKAVMFGPIDPSGVFGRGTPNSVKEAAKEVLKIFKDGGLVIGAGCALPKNTPEENIIAFVETVKEYGKY